MLMVIFGAGASYDSHPSESPPREDGPQISNHDVENNRPPLANQLFDDRPEFSDTLRRFPECMPIIPRLRHPQEGLSVEEVLQKFKLQTELYPERHSQLAAIRYYLQMMISECERRWDRVHRGITNYVTLLDQIRPILKTEEKVCMVTFNYDSMLEKALAPIQGPLNNLTDYINKDKFEVVIFEEGSEITTILFLHFSIV